jgi:hypothetical protein
VSTTHAPQSLRLDLLVDDLLALSGVDADTLPTVRYAPAAFDLAYRGQGEGATRAGPMP